LQPYTVRQILAWADAYQRSTGKWPKRNSGPVEPASPEKWSMVDTALTNGLRGLPPGSSLAKLLAERRGARNDKRLPKLSLRKIVAWADAYHRRTGRWPIHTSGPIPEAPGETWSAVQNALYLGRRGFPGGDSLFKLLQRHGRRRTRHE
jgi:hypothetical protein